MKSLPNKISVLWFNLVEPPESINQQDKRRQARLLSATIIILVIAGIVSYLIPIMLGSWFILSEFIVILTGISLWTGVYLLNRRGHLKLAVLIFCTSISLMIFGSILTTDSPIAYTLIYYLMLPVIIGSAFLPLHWVLLMGFINIGVITLIELSVDFLDPIIMRSFFLLLTTLLLILMMHYRTQVEADRQEEVKAEEARYRMLFNALSDGVVVHKDGMIRDVNLAFMKMYGYTYDELIGHSIMEFIARDYHLTTQHNMQHLEMQPYEIHTIKKDGSTLQVEIVGTFYTYRGEKLRAAVVRDITERKQIEQQHIQLELERQRNQLMQRFIGDASHDLKNPMTVILTTLHLLKRSPDDSKRDQRIQMLEQQTLRLNTLIQDMLTTARLQKAAEDRFDFQARDLNEIVQQVIHEQRIQAETKNLELVFDGAALPPLLIDGQEMIRAVRQLIVNALNYTHTGGVYIRTRHIEDRAILEVRDTGIGMNAEDTQLIFEAFYRADHGRKSAPDGIGLGLAFARRIVQAHGGDIRVESEINKGSTFSIVLPVAFDGSVENLAPYPLV